MKHSLQQIAQGCWNGACNPVGLLRSLGDAMQSVLAPLSKEDAADLCVILDHLACLVPRQPDIDLAARYEPKPAAPQMRMAA